MKVVCDRWRYLRLRWAMAVALNVIPGACANVPAQQLHEMPQNITVQTDLRYREGKSSAWRLDLAYPKDAGTNFRPGLIVIHGGGWIEGDKSSFTSLKNWAPGNIIDFAKLGFVAASVNYRMSGEEPFPAALEDCKNAVRWLRAHASDYQVDVNRIRAFGNSAGGHLALLLGLIGKEAGLEGSGSYQEQSSMVQAVISDSGPVDLDFRKSSNKVLEKVMSQFLAGPGETLLERIQQASPVSYINIKGFVPPLLLIYGTADTQVTIRPVDEFVVRLQEAGHKDVSYIRLGSVDHCPYSLRREESLYPIVDRFLLRTLMK